VEGARMLRAEGGAPGMARLVRAEGCVAGVAAGA